MFFSGVSLFLACSTVLRVYVQVFIVWVVLLKLWLPSFVLVSLFWVCWNEREYSQQLNLDFVKLVPIRLHSFGDHLRYWKCSRLVLASYSSMTHIINSLLCFNDDNFGKSTHNRSIRKLRPPPRLSLHRWFRSCPGWCLSSDCLNVAQLLKLRRHTQV